MTTSTHFINAKIILVGDTGVGKSGLCNRITKNKFIPTIPNTNVEFFYLKVPPDFFGKDEKCKIDAELTFWDLPSQQDYLLSNQLLMEDADLALLIFDYANPTDPFRGVSRWAEILNTRVPKIPKLLVSARSDVSSVTVTQYKIQEVLDKYKINGYLITNASAKDEKDTGIGGMLQVIQNNISWDKLLHLKDLSFLNTVRQILIDYNNKGYTLVPMHRLLSKVTQYLRENESLKTEFDTLINYLQSRGEVYRLESTPKLTFILLKPQLINEFIASIVQLVNMQSQGLYAIQEHDIISIEISKELPPDDHKNMIESTVELLIRCGLCTREKGMLIFPSLPLPVYKGQLRPAEVIYQFSKNPGIVFSGLSVDICNTEEFEVKGRWRDLCELSKNNQNLGISIREIKQGINELAVSFSSSIEDKHRQTHLEHIHNYLNKITNKNKKDERVDEVEEHILHYCPNCTREVTDYDAIKSHKLVLQRNINLSGQEQPDAL
jgi:small GTP-binding protein